MIQAHTERLNSLDSDFKEHHSHIIELADEEDQQTLEWEQALLDNHEGKTTKWRNVYFDLSILS